MHHDAVPRDLPSGDVTFLFTDVEGSTRLLHELGEERLLARWTEREAWVLQLVARRRPPRDQRVWNDALVTT